MQPNGGGYPAIRFDAISRAWAVYQSQMGLWIVIALIIVVIGGGVILAIDLLVFLALSIPLGESSLWHPAGIAVSILSSTVAFVLHGAGLNAAIKHVRGQGVQIEYLAEVSARGAKLIVVAILMAVATTIATLLCVLPVFVVNGLLMFSIPLVVDKDMEAVDAIRQSVEMLKSQWLMATLFYFVVSILGTIGLIACLVGVIFTLPMYFLSIAVVYNDFVEGAA